MHAKKMRSHPPSCGLILLVFASLIVGSGCGFQQAPVPSLSPQSATVTVQSAQQFSIAGLPGGTIWLVNNEPGGNRTVGTIDATGLYLAPVIPPLVPVTITAQSRSFSGVQASATVQVVNPTPDLTAVAPSIAIANGQPLGVTVSGTQFTPQSRVTANGTAYATTFVSGTELQATLPVDALQPGATISITADTPAPGGGHSASKSIAVVAPLSPQAVVLTVSAQLQFVMAPLAGGTTWLVNDAPGGSSVAGTISTNGLYQAPMIPPALPVTIRAQSTQYPAVNSSAAVQVVNPAPQLTSVSPAITIANGQPLAITVTGANLTPQSVVVVGGNACPTTFVSSTELQATIAAAAVEGAANLAVSVNNPAPGGGRSDAANIVVVASGTVSLTQHPLVAQYQLLLPQDGGVVVEFGTDTTYGRRTGSVSPPAGGGAVTVLVAGMRAATAYHMRARITLADGTTLLDADHTLTTGALPAVSFPSGTVSRTPGLSSGGGVDLVSSSRTVVTAAVLDNDGQVIWYYYDPAISGGAFPIRELDNGNFLVTMGTHVREVDLTGTVVREVTLDQINASLTSLGYSFQLDSIHHDLLRLSNGHWLLLANEWQQFQDLPGYPGTTAVIGDDLIEVDASGQPVWIWRAFDHLDVNRHPIWFPDWTHANALVLRPDGNLLLSMRHQSWIIKIDYENGAGTGDVLWRLGPDGDFTLAGGDPAQWFFCQHYPLLVTSDGPQFRLAMFDNGDARPDALGQPCVFSGTCYSRGLMLDVDESTRTAAVAWQDLLGWFALWGGSMAVLPNGNIEIDSSTVNGGPTRIVEVTSDATPKLVWELVESNATYYRAYRIPSLYPGVQW